MARAPKRKRRKIDPSIGLRITELREGRSIKRDDLAKRLRIHPLRMWRLETGLTHVPAEDLKRIAALLEEPIESFYAPPSPEVEARAS